MDRNFEVSIQDLDGEEHAYLIIAPTPWAALAHIAKEMNTRGDFYGHTSDTTSTVRCVELVEDAKMPNAVRVA